MGSTSDDSRRKVLTAPVPIPAPPVQSDSGRARTPEPKVGGGAPVSPASPPNLDSIVARLTDSITKAAKADSVKFAELRRLNRRGANGQQLATQHPWLRANGDSASAPLAPGSPQSAGFQKAIDEIQGHMQRANQAIMGGQLQKVAPELRDAQSELTILREVLPPGSPAPPRLQQRLMELRRQAYQACTSIAADTVGMLRCRVFQPGANQGGGRAGRGGSAPPPLP